MLIRGKKKSKAIDIHRLNTDKKSLKYEKISANQCQSVAKKKAKATDVHRLNTDNKV